MANPSIDLSSCRFILVTFFFVWIIHNSVIFIQSIYIPGLSNRPIILGRAQKKSYVPFLLIRDFF